MASAGDRSTRAFLLRCTLYAFVLLSGCMQVAVVPLLPAYGHRFGLSGVEQGMLLACTGVATLGVALPSGALSDRLGARRVTLWAGALMAAAALLEAVAPSFGVLLLSRLLFGAGYGVTWTSGLSWLSEISPSRSSIGGSVTSGGIGSVAGPALFGYLAQYLGLSIPFLGAAVAFVVVTAGLALGRPAQGEAASSSPIGAGLLVAMSDRCTISAAAAIVVAGITSGVAYLLVPEELHAAGSSSGAIGLAFSAAGVLFVAASVITASTGRRAVRLAVAVGGMLVLALAMSPAVASTASLAVVGMLCATAGARAVVWTVAYPLGAVGAERSGAGIGLVMGLLNGVWAVVAVVSPLLAGVVAEHAGDRTAFALAEVVSIGIALATAMFAVRSRHSLAFSSLQNSCEAS
ncbi:MAG: MFS transporter, partial [Acidimicrobiales bacterium]